jgi:hypothetical protein
MYNRESNAAQLTAICLEKCGLSRNISKVVEVLEQSLYGNQAAENLDKYDDSGNYADLQYEGTPSIAATLIRDGKINSELAHNFSDTEVKLLNAFAVDGVLRIDSLRTDFAEHEIDFALDVPLSPNKLTDNKIRIYVKLLNVKLGLLEFDIEVSTSEEDELKAAKAVTLYSLS